MFMPQKLNQNYDMNFYSLKINFKFVKSKFFNLLE